MNAIRQIEAQALASAFTRGTDQLPRALRVTTNDVCNILRTWSMPSHDEWVTVVANLATKAKTANALSAAATAVIVDMLDEIVGQIEQDKIDQQAEQMWLDSKREAV